MQATPEALYLDLLKQTLAYLLWPEPPRPVEPADFPTKPVKRWVLGRLLPWLARRRMQLVRQAQVSNEARETGLFWPRLADTMIGLRRLDNIQQCVLSVLDRGIAGDLIETGVWRGGASIFMRGILAARGVTDRRVFVADSFRGLPPPDPQRYPADAGDPLHEFAELAISRERVEQNFRKYGLLDEQVVFLEGWFSDTLPTAPIERLAILRLDGDMYGSTIEALEALYPKLSDGGYCIIDDYALTTCRQAVDDYRHREGINSALQSVDWTGVYWRKGA